jgi:hypothetical protein
MSTTQLPGPGLENLTGSLQNIIQDGILWREFQDHLTPNIVFRSCFTHVYPNASLGQRFLYNQSQDLSDVPDPITPAANTDMNNGMTPVDPAGIEQYALKLNRYGNTLDTNLLVSSLSMENQFAKNARDLGRNAGRSLDKAARGHLNAAYGGGLTYVTADATAASSVNVANVFGFDFKMVDGVPTAVSATNKLAIVIDSTAVNVQGISGVTVDRDIDWAPGTLQLDANVTAVVGDKVLASTAPIQVDTNGINSNPYLLTSSSSVDTDTVLAMISQLEDDSVPPHDDMYYHFYLDPITYAQLYADSKFREIFRGAGNEDIYTRGALGAFGNALFFKTQVSAKDTRTLDSGSVMVRHFIATGGEVGLEGRYGDMDKISQLAGMNQSIIMTEFDSESHVMLQHRSPLDRHGEVVSSSWKFLGGFTIRTDSLTLSESRNYGRAVVGRCGTAR